MIKKITVSHNIKRLLAGVGLVLLAGFLTIASVNHWEEQKNTKITAQKVAAEARVARQNEEKAKLQARIDTLTKAYDKERLNCERGLGILNALPRSTQNTIKVENRPVCGPAVVR